jgi:predicted DNA binding CopG/RHH family protein
MKRRIIFNSKPTKVKKKPEKTKESVKVSIALLEKIKANKATTGITITAFVEQAIQDKLKTK